MRCRTRLTEALTEAPKAPLRLPTSNPGVVVVLTPKKTEDGEFAVRVMANGRDIGKTYFTSDWEDAVGTAKHMAASWK